MHHVHLPAWVHLRACCAHPSVCTSYAGMHLRLPMQCMRWHYAHSSTFPQGQRRSPAEGHPPQAPAWQTLSHRCRPQPSTLPQTRPHWYSAMAHGTDAVSWPHWQVRVRAKLHGGQSPANGRDFCS